VPDADNFKLIIEDDEGRRSVVEVDLGEISIGRDEGNTIRLNERNVSRQHARLLRDDASFFAEDLDSYNGVWVNGDRIQGRYQLHEGDLIRIGDFHLELRGEGLQRRTEETTQRTVIPVPEATQPQIRMGPDGVPQPPPRPARAPVPAPAAAEHEPAANEATAIIRMDAPELKAPRGQTATIAGLKAKLVCVSTQFAGRELEIGKTEVVIGRTADNDLAIDHRSVSRHHAKIVVAGRRYLLHDLKSANGTFVNGETYAQTELSAATSSSSAT
jgi:pSer/pThr/pTyr-binding forkhead associated (FHA) protein